MRLVILLFALPGFCYVEMTSHSNKPKIINMERLNTAADEDDPSPSPDGNQFLYTTVVKEEKTLFLATRASANEALSKGKPMEELSGEGSCLCPCLQARDKDGWEYLYFATQYHTDARKKNYDLYRVGRFNPLRPFQGFNAASPIQATTTESDEIAPWVSADAKVLYFSRRTASGWQLMKCVAQQPHSFEKPESVGLEIGYHRAVLSKTMLTMIVQGPLKSGETRQGLFVCKRARLDEPWASPRPITSINSDEGAVGTVSPALSGDTRFLYFASDRPGGKGGLDLYVVAVSEVDELKK